MNIFYQFCKLFCKIRQIFTDIGRVSGLARGFESRRRDRYFMRADGGGRAFQGVNLRNKRVQFGRLRRFLQKRQPVLRVLAKQ